ncbi:MAG: GNAT family N-acetyltransferase [Endomicrobiaceae bacterium]
MQLNSLRLKIIPLELQHFKLLLSDTCKMEEALNLNPSGSRLDEHTISAMRWLYGQAENHKENYLFYTNWQIILKSENISIGSACFKGIPDITGTVEIGYGIDEKFRCNGYMTEAVKEILKWALNQPDVKYVIAETEKINHASHKVMIKSGMIRFKETDSTCFWKTK